MRIISKETICGIEIIAIRNFLRKSGRLQMWRAEYLSSSLKLSPEQVNELLFELENRGFIEKDKTDYGEQYWHNTVSGNALGGASATKPYKRTTAEKALAEFMERVGEINSNPYYLYKVTKVILFGSYLSNALEVSDVDIALEITSKEEDEERRGEQLQQRREALEKKGKRFNNIVEWAGAAEIEVWDFLKSRSRVISMHIATDELLELVGGNIVFDETK